MSRQEANRELLKELGYAVEAHPDWRFGQILHNLGVLKMVPVKKDSEFVCGDPFYQESTETLVSVKLRLQQMAQTGDE